MTTEATEATEALDTLDAACGDWLRNERIEMQFVRFPNGFGTLGEQVTCSLAEELDYRAQFLNRSLPLHSSGELADRKNLQPLEVGIISKPHTVGDRVFARRRKTDVVAMTWIFIDCDSGADPMPLAKALHGRDIAFILTESSTSRLGGSGIYKWHLFLPLAKPKQLAQHGPGVAVVETAEASALWWGRVHAHVAERVLRIGGLESVAVDASADRMCQGVYIPHRPDASPARFLAPRKTSGARLLDLDAFLEATGFEDIDPPVVMLDDLESSPQPQLPDDADEGSTPGETTGTLLIKALQPFSTEDGRSLVGTFDSANNHYEVLCPWRHEHTSAVEKSTQDRYSSSTVVMMSGGPKGDGGFKCFHDGCREAVGHEVSAADVISWARKNGNTLIPDRPTWSGVDVPTPKAAKPEDLPPTPALAFALAPHTEAEPPRVASAATTTLPPKEARIDITIDWDDLQGMIEAGIKALGKHPAYYTATAGSANVLVELVQNDNGNPYIRTAKAATFSPALQQVSRWAQPAANKQGAQPIPQVPPDRTVASILAAGRYPGVRPLHGIITTPAFHSDGVIIQDPGYCRELGVIYASQSRIPLVSPDPSLSSLIKAKADLLDVIKDFPFKAGHEDLCRGVWLAAILTRLLRTTYQGNVPMFAISAGARSSGKGKLVDSVAIITDGVDARTVGFSADEAENERVIGMILKGDAPVVSIDNVDKPLASSTWEQFLTTSSFSTREIGSSTSITKKKKESVGGLADSLFFATGNGLQTGGDMSRRVLRIDIDDRTGKPSDRAVTAGREGLTDWVKRNRPRLLAAALTLCTGYFAARRRGYKINLPTFASFEQWSIVREVIVWAGLPDPMLARGKATTDDTVANLGLLIENMLAYNKGAEVPQVNMINALARDAKAPKPVHSGFYNFLAEAASLPWRDPDKANEKFGKWLSNNKYVGQTYLAEDGRCWQITKRRTADGYVIGLVAV